MDSYKVVVVGGGFVEIQMGDFFRKSTIKKGERLVNAEQSSIFERLWEASGCKQRQGSSRKLSDHWKWSSSHKLHRFQRQKMLKVCKTLKFSLGKNMRETYPDFPAMVLLNRSFARARPADLESTRQ